MTRHLARLADDTFDVIVVGGGIYGLAAAHALTRRGLSVALVERRDFGGATSFNSLKTVHGGIRSLQHGALADAREFVRERRAVATLAPHLVRVLPFAVPTAMHPVRNRPAMALFLAAYDIVAGDRNAGLDPAVHLPGSFTVGRASATELNPLVSDRGLTGAAVWHDYQLHSPERFALALVRSIVDAGGMPVNYIEATGFLRRGDRIEGVSVRDTLGGQPFDVRAKAVVNAAGPWAWPLLASAGIPARADAGFSLALNLVLDRPPLPRALGGIAGGRFLFLVPWRDRSILGTSHEGFHRDPRPNVAAADVEHLLAEGIEAFPKAGLDPGRITLVHRGLLPARASGSAHGALLKQSVVHDHRADGLSGLVTVVGVRYTTAGATALRTAHTVQRLLGRKPSSPPVEPLSQSRFGGLDTYLRRHPERARLVRRYGTLHADLPADAVDPVAAGTDVTRAELLYAVRSEFATSLADAALRRTDLAAGGHPGAAVLRAAARLLATELGWDEAREAAEIASLERALTLAPSS